MLTPIYRVPSGRVHELAALPASESKSEMKEEIERG